MTAVPLHAPALLEEPGSEPWTRRLHTEQVWDATVGLDLRGPHLDATVDDVLTESVAYLHQVDAWFGAHRTDAAISLHRDGRLPLTRTPIEVQEVLAGCRFARQLTGGAFDPWAAPGGLDPAEYVSGWAADRVADAIVRAGVPNVSVHAAGVVVCRGRQAPGEPWAVGIRDPREPGRLVGTVSVYDGAVATSGLDETGGRVEAGRRVHYDRATVVGPDGGLAAALAAAALVTGPAAAAWFALLPDWSAQFVRCGRAAGIGPAFTVA